MVTASRRLVATVALLGLMGMADPPVSPDPSVEIPTGVQVADAARDPVPAAFLVSDQHTILQPLAYPDTRSPAALADIPDRFPDSGRTLRADAGTHPGLVTPTIEVRGADAAEAELANWALGRFEEAGLQLPDTIITFHDNPHGCSGNSGLFRHGEPAEVHLCIPAERPAKTRKLIALHELGHAWAETHTDPTTRAAFLTERSIDTWYDPHQQPHLWGAEHAAETISWALMDEPVRIIRIYDAAPDQLGAAYQVLTGSNPLNAQ
jgi:hypothetical protein